MEGDNEFKFKTEKAKLFFHALSAIGAQQLHKEGQAISFGI